MCVFEHLILLFFHLLKASIFIVVAIIFRRIYVTFFTLCLSIFYCNSTRFVHITVMRHLNSSIQFPEPSEAWKDHHQSTVFYFGVFGCLVLRKMFNASTHGTSNKNRQQGCHHPLFKKESIVNRKRWSSTYHSKNLRRHAARWLSVQMVTKRILELIPDWPGCLSAKHSYEQRVYRCTLLKGMHNHRIFKKPFLH